MAIKAALQEPRIATSLVGFCRPEEVCLVRSLHLSIGTARRTACASPVLATAIKAPIGCISR